MEINKGQRRPSFLQKFQGKKKKIGKQGILLLLQQKLSAMRSKEKTILSNHQKKLQKLQSHSVPNKLQYLRSKDREKQIHISAETPKDRHRQSSALRKQILSNKQLPDLIDQRQSKRQARSQRLIGRRQKLPCIKKRLNHSRSSLRIPAQHSEMIFGAKLQKSQSFPSKAGRIKRLSERMTQEMLMLDQVARGHLKSLDQFQKLLFKQKIENNEAEPLQQQK